MRDRPLSTGARYRVGWRIGLELRRWAEVLQGMASITRGEIFDNDLFLQTHCSGEEVSP